MKSKIIITGTILGAIATAGAAHATPTAADRQTVTSKAYVDTEIATRQPKLEAQDGDYAVVYPNSENSEGAGEVSARPIIGYIEGADYEGELITAGAVKTALDSKQDNISGTAGNVVVYDNDVGAVGSKPVYNSSAQYNTQTTALVQANQVNAAVVKGLTDSITCAGYDTPGDNTTPCVLYNINAISNVF